MPIFNIRNLRIFFHRVAAASFSVWLVSSGQAHAVADSASFDCAKAATVVEKTICRTPALAALDRQLSSSYKAALKAESGDGKVSLREEQRLWTRYVGILCDKTGLEKIQYVQSTDGCIESEYQKRMQQFPPEVSTVDGVTFRWVNVLYARRSNDKDDSTGRAPYFSTFEARYPQIDAPRSEAERAWNRRIYELYATSSLDDGAANDFWFQYDILLVSPRLISVSVDSLWYGHGAAHGMGGTSAMNWLVNEARELKAEDLFKSGSQWESFIKKYCFDNLSGRGFTGVQALDSLGDKPLEMTRWLITKFGIKIHFNPYEVGSYSEGSAEVYVPWNELREYMVADLPIAIDP